MNVQIKVIKGPDQGRSFLFEQRDRLMVGRSPETQLCVSGDPKFSRYHFMVEINPPNLLLIDLKSTNGTYVNDDPNRIAGTTLKHGDRIRGGDTVLLVEVLEEPEEQVPPTNIPARPQQGFSLDDLLPGVPKSTSDRADVRCLRCGSRASNEQPRPRSESVAYFCEPCQAEILKQPILLPGYQVVRELGRGGMGAVYLALHQTLGVKRALKVVLPKAALSDKVRKMFIREAAEQAKLKHPSIVEVFDLQEVKPGIFCIAMEFVEGDNAEKLLTDAGGRGLPAKLAASIIAGGLEGLGYAHSRGVVHRDVKDANLLVSRGPGGAVSVKLSDFGLAKSYEASGASGFTSTGSMGGTIPYMAPEQIINFRHVKPPADIYSMGATLYHLLCGEYPYDFGAADPLLVVLEHPIVPLRTRNSQIPAALASVAERALSKKPEDRFGSAEEMRRAIQAACP
jgi:serine/threonine-protein kinase